MSKKSVLMATLLAGMSAFTGCEKKTEASEQKEAKVQHVEESEKIKKFEKISKSIPIFRDE